MSTEQAITPPDGAPSSTEETVDDAVFYEDEVEPEYGILGFTLRELVILGAWALAFIVSFFPVHSGGPSVWTSGIDWILTIGVPTVAVFLVVLRRFSPDGIRRVGSLGIDQFASVAATVAGAVWAQLLWHQTSASVQTGALLVGWVPIVAQIATLALIVATVAAPLVPGLREDFEGRMETLAHRNADPVRPVIRRPRPVAVEPVSDAGSDSTAASEEADLAADADAEEADSAPIDSTPIDSELTVSVDDNVQAAADEPAAIDWTPSDAFDTDAAVDSDAEGDSEAAATRVIDVIDLSPAVDAPRADAAVAASAAETVAAGLPPEQSDQREAGTAYTDPIGALHEIFETKGTFVPDAPGNVTAPIGTLEFAELADAETGPDDGVGHDGSADSESEAPLRRNRTERPRTPELGAQPFWILAGTERDVLDERGHVLYSIGPTAWTLVIEDRDGAYVVRHDDGRIGYLHDLTDITKG